MRTWYTGPIYSPSQTMLYDRCKWKWYLSKRLGATARAIAKRDIAAGVGTGVGTALAAYYRQIMNNKPVWATDEVVLTAGVVYNKYMSDLSEQGREIIGIKEEITYPELISKLIRAYFKNPAIQEGWTIKGTEDKCGEDNNSYIDAWGECDRGVWQLDWKCKMFSRANDRDNQLLQYSKSWQMSHYVWSLHRLLGEWPKFTRICMLFGEPTTECRWNDFEVDTDYMKWWETSAMRIWGDIEQTENELTKARDYGVDLPEIVPMATSHYDGIFKCDMYDLCFLYGGDVESASPYIQVETNVKT